MTLQVEFGLNIVLNITFLAINPTVVICTILEYIQSHLIVWVHAQI